MINRLGMSHLRMGCVIAAMLVSALQGCTNAKHAKFENKMISAFSTCNSQQRCALHVSDLTEFRWDKLYVFKHTAGRREVESILGTKLTEFEEIHRRIVFTKAGSVVFHEEEPTEIERPIADEVVFDIPDTQDYKVYSSDVTFSVQHVKT